MPKPGSTRRAHLRAMASVALSGLAPAGAGVLAGCDRSKKKKTEVAEGADAAEPADGAQGAKTSAVQKTHGTSPRQGRAGQPHVLFISIDDLNDWVGCLGGHPQCITPNLDKLAAASTLFTNAHCAGPNCNASRTSTLTGLRPSSTGIYANNQPWRPHLPDAITIPEMFRKSGYRTIGAGKLFHGGYVDERGWDDYFPKICRQRPNDPRVEGKPLNGIPRTGHFDWGAIDVDEEDMADAKVAKWVVENLPRKGAPPTFLACGLYRPHLPWFVPRKYFKKFPLDKIILPEVKKGDRKDIPRDAFKDLPHGKDHKKVKQNGQWEIAVQAYLASCAFADTMLGRVIDGLEKSGAMEDTVVVLWSDHGWHLGEKLRWRKFTLWEEATRVPLMFKVPGAPAGECPEAASLMDVYPTLVELCDLQDPPLVEGTSLVPLIDNPSLHQSRGAVTSWGPDAHSVRTRQFRYTRYSEGGRELYDHDVDPGEFDNLAERKEHQSLIKDLDKRLPKRGSAPAPTRKSYTRAQLACRGEVIEEDDD